MSTTPYRFIRSRIADNPTANGLLGGRVYQDEAPQGVATPYAVMQRVASVDQRTMANASGGGLYFESIDIDICADDRATAQTAADAIRAAVVAGLTTVGSARVELSTITGIGIDIAEPALDGGDMSLYRRQIQARIIWRQP